MRVSSTLPALSLLAAAFASPLDAQTAAGTAAETAAETATETAARTMSPPRGDAEDAGLRAAAGLVDGLSKIILRLAVMGGRNFADVTYRSIASDAAAGTVTLTGLRVNPTWNPNFPDYGYAGDAPDCVIAADRIEIAGDPISAWDSESAHGAIAIEGLEIAPTCLPPPVTQQISAFGYDRVAVERVEIAYAYDLPTSALSLSATLGVAEAAAITVKADFGYAWAPNYGEAVPEPALLLRHAELRVDDDGLAARGRVFLAAQRLRGTELAAQIEAALRQGLMDPQGLLAPALARFAAEAGEAAAALVEQGGAATVALAPDEPVWLDVETPPAEQIAALAPRAAHVPADAVDIVAAPAALREAMAAIAAGRAPALERDAALALARGLRSGIGAPYAPGMALALIEPLAAAGDAEAQRFLALALPPERAAEAYAAALLGYAGRAGGVDGVDGATRAEGAALVETLERRLPLDEAFEIQARLNGAGAAAPADLAPALLRKAASAAAEGRGGPRDYARAYRLATLAAALGDAPAAGLRARLDRRFSTWDGAAWASRAAALRRAAAQDWLTRVDPR